jgi:hypothetical protein
MVDGCSEAKDKDKAGNIFEQEYIISILIVNSKDLRSCLRSYLADTLEFRHQMKNMDLLRTIVVHYMDLFQMTASADDTV